MPQTRKEKKIFTLIGEDRKTRKNLDVTSPPPTATFITTDRAEALKKQKEFKTKYNDVRLSIRDRKKSKFLQLDPQHPKDFAGKPKKRSKKK